MSHLYRSLAFRAPRPPEGGAEPSKRPANAPDAFYYSAVVQFAGVAFYYSAPRNFPRFAGRDSAIVGIYYVAGPCGMGLAAPRSTIMRCGISRSLAFCNGGSCARVRVIQNCLRASAWARAGVGLSNTAKFTWQYTVNYPWHHARLAR